MHPKVKAALNELKNQASISGYFSHLEPIVPDSLKYRFNELKGKFMAGNHGWDFPQILETFAREVDGYYVKEEDGDTSNPVFSLPTFGHPINNIIKDYASSQSNVAKNKTLKQLYDLDYIKELTWGDRRYKTCTQLATIQYKGNNYNLYGYFYDSNHDSDLYVHENCWHYPSINNLSFHLFWEEANEKNRKEHIISTTPVRGKANKEDLLFVKLNRNRFPTIIENEEWEVKTDFNGDNILIFPNEALIDLSGCPVFWKENGDLAGFLIKEKDNNNHVLFSIDNISNINNGFIRERLHDEEVLFESVVDNLYINPNAFHSFINDGKYDLVHLKSLNKIEVEKGKQYNKVKNYIDLRLSSNNPLKRIELLQKNLAKLPMFQSYSTFFEKNFRKSLDNSNLVLPLLSLLLIASLQNEIDRFNDLIESVLLNSDIMRNGQKYSLLKQGAMKSLWNKLEIQESIETITKGTYYPLLTLFAAIHTQSIEVLKVEGSYPPKSNDMESESDSPIFFLLNRWKEIETTLKKLNGNATKNENISFNNEMFKTSLMEMKDSFLECFPETQTPAFKAYILLEFYKIRYPT